MAKKKSPASPQSQLVEQLAPLPPVEYTAAQIALLARNGKGCKKNTVVVHARRLIDEGLITGRKIAQTMVYSQAEADLIISQIKDKQGNPKFAE